jgi:hypothetical protein
VLRPEQIESEGPDLIHKLPAEAMTKHTYMTFGEIEGKLDTLRVECTRCQTVASLRISLEGER